MSSFLVIKKNLELSDGMGARMLVGKQNRVIPTPPSPLPYDSEIEYLESTGTQYINTLLETSGGSNQVNSGYQVEIQYRYTSQPNNDTWVFGYWGTNPSTRSYLIGYYNGYRCEAGPDNSSYWATIPYDTNFHVAKLLISGAYYDDVWLTPTDLQGLPAHTGGLWLFKSEHTDSGGTRQIKYCKMWTLDNVLVCDFIPVRVGQIGYMYDKVSGQLFGNQGSGNFILGNDVQSKQSSSLSDDSEEYAIVTTMKKHFDFDISYNVDPANSQPVSSFQAKFPNDKYDSLSVTPSYAHHRFLGWHTQANDASNEYAITSGSQKVSSDNVDCFVPALYGNWQAATSVTLVSQLYDWNPEMDHDCYVGQQYGELPKYTGSSEQQFRYLRMNISKLRSSSTTVVQLSRIDFLDSNGNMFQWPNGAIVTCTIQGQNSTGAANEYPSHIIDGNTGTKYCSGNWSSNPVPCILTIDLGVNSVIDIATYSKWRWYTANDASERDPISFTLEASNDGETWIELDSIENANITTTRQAIAYTGDITIADDKNYYSEIEYLYSPANSYIDTGIQYHCHTVQMKFKLDGSSDSDIFLFGLNGYSYTYPHVTPWSNKYSIGKLGAVADYQGPDLDSNDHTFIYDPYTGQFSLDGTNYTQLPQYSQYQNFTGGNIMLGYRGGSISGFRRIYWAKIYDNENNILVRDFIPVRKGQIGYLYDKVSGEFFGNSGSSQFILGPDIVYGTGHRSLGWYTQQRTPDKTATTVGSRITSTSLVSYRPTLYALWQLPSDITFDATTNGGSMQPWSHSYYMTMSYRELPPVDDRQHYYYEGWFTQATGGTKVTMASIVPGDTTLYAQWSAGVTITFDATTNGGQMPSDWISPDYFAGHAYGTLPVPTHSRLTFVGWYLDGELIDENSIVPAGGTVLIAQYAAMTYTVDISNGDWVLQSPNTNPDTTAYNGVYQSDRYHGSPPSSGCVVKMYINTVGYQTFDVYIRSNGENGWSYAIAVKPDIDPSSYSEAMSNALADTNGKATGTTSIDGYTKVTYDLGGGNHRICIAYIHKDSYTVGDDRGYVLIPKPSADNGIYLSDLDDTLYDEPHENEIILEEEEE